MITAVAPWASGGTSSSETALVTSSLADGATHDTSFPIRIAEILKSIETTDLCWVRLYGSAAARAADAARPINQDPETGVVLCEFSLDGSLFCAPPPTLISYDDPAVIFTSIKNISGATATITVTLNTLSLK